MSEGTILTNDTYSCLGSKNADYGMRLLFVVCLFSHILFIVYTSPSSVYNESDFELSKNYSIRPYKSKRLEGFSIALISLTPFILTATIFTISRRDNLCVKSLIFIMLGITGGVYVLVIFGFCYVKPFVSALDTIVIISILLAHIITCVTCGAIRW